MSESAIQLRGLTKTFDAVEAVRGIDLDVGEGELFGFLGPNGAGKSTTINILCTLTKATSGSAVVAGHDVSVERAAVRGRIGLVFQEPTLDTYLTAEQNLHFHGELYGVPRARLRERMDDVLTMVGLSERRKDLVQTFSGGMRRRLEIARGLLHFPKVLFLDEPTIGLDPQTRAAIWDYVGKLRQTEDITIFVTTHYMEEAEYCDRIAIIDGGEIVAIDTPEALKGTIGADRVQIHTNDDDAAIAQLGDRLGVDAAVHEGMVTFAVPQGAQFVPRLFAALNVEINTVTITRPSLDDVFMAYTGRTIRDAEESGGSQHPFRLMAGKR
ncbi:ATP-binding cassette domain-containing protein [Actinobacteria bacterium YIM 96077]|uniref:ABC transporter ATP-binding protein n=1 Tax=Phytoactinopolyspora halophila TaxID=1981511 RepID=A0A329QHY5_9ACTN|nr:ATP-binding cassette domain-containing protein [Phytoactinopolyspora halophila]AYY12396.1 ATP-binding cassette domain-containing protein [Actinobacteria bacterium YIM 96077]RAW12027.1 ABC transporter ATP-binding protein [Phytoactinopolyspora halophila]